MGLSYRNAPVLSIAAIGTLLGSETMVGRSPLTSAFLLPASVPAPLRGRTALTRGEALHAIAIDRETDRTSPSEPTTSCKYDLGLGKNAPVVTSKVSRIGNANNNNNNNIGDNHNCNDNETDDGVGLPTESTIGCSSPYEATRFLVEHEAVRTYPAPDSIREAGALGSPLSANPNEAPTTTTTTTTLTSSVESESTIERNAPKHHHQSKPTTTKGATTSISTITTTTSTSTTTKSRSKLQARRPVAKVQPKRSLEDCLTILDHHHHCASSALSNGTETAAAAAAATHTQRAPSTIVSVPNSPQLDMNSIWVEMLLHNQIAQSRIQA